MMTGGVPEKRDDPARVIRRLRLLRALDAIPNSTMTGACSAVESILRAQAESEVPLALLYLVEGTQAVLHVDLGLAPGTALNPETVPLEEPHVLPLGEVAGSGIYQRVDGLKEFELGSPDTAVIFPLPELAIGPILGVLVLGVPDGGLDPETLVFLAEIAQAVSRTMERAFALLDVQRRLETLQTLDRAKSGFLSDASFELRTPLTLMLAPLTRLIESGELTGSQRHELWQVHDNAERLLNMVGSLLDFSRLEDRRSTHPREALDVAAHTHGITSSFRSAFENAGLTLEVDCPPLSRPVDMDPGLWETVVSQLLKNAFEATFEGEVTITLREQHDSFSLRVSDTGCGIPEEELPQVFERFYRVAGTTTRRQDTAGVGLSLVRELVRLGGGVASAQSRLGEGSTFEIRVPFTGAIEPLPRSQESRSPAAPVIRPEREQEETHGRVLLVDDNADMLEFLERLLEPHFFVELAADGLDALEKARLSMPDLILSDIVMPRLDGIGMLKELRADERTRSIPVILISARAGDGAQTDGLEAGADDYLVKPFSTRQLLARVRGTLELSRMRVAEARREEANQLLEGLAQASLVISRASTLPEALERIAVQARGLVGAQQGVCTLMSSDPEEPGARPDSLILPLVGQTGERIGVLEVWDKREGEIFTSIDEGILNQLVALASSVIESVQARQEAERANLMKSHFLANLSHEIRTPMTGIVGNCNLLTHSPLNEEQATCVSTIHLCSDALLALVNDVLDLSKIEAGKMELESRPFELSQILEDARKIVEREAERLGIAFQLETGHEVKGWVLGDAVRLRQVLLNLLSNAIKFTPAGRVTLKALLLEQSADWMSVRLEVEDTGIGIAPEDQESLFQAFRQIDSSAGRQQQGTGLGLVICRQLVHAMGGELGVRSQLGSGSTFWVVLDLARVEKPATLDVASSPLATPRSREKIKVLLAEDNPINQRVTSLQLEKLGYSVDVVASGTAVLDSVLQETYDVILMDCHMPGWDGYETTRRIRQLAGSKGKIPIIALTASVLKGEEERCRAAGMDDYISKPVNMQALTQCLERHAPLAGEETRRPTGSPDG